MILSTGAITALLKSTDKAIPEVGDSEVTVPQGLSLVHHPLLALDYVQSSTSIQNGSIIINDIRSRGALDPAGAVTLATLAAGLWNLHIKTWGNTNENTNNGAFYTLLYQGSTIYLTGNSFFSTLFQDDYVQRILLRESAILVKNWGATGAGAFSNFNSSVVCTREL